MLKTDVFFIFFVETDMFCFLEFIDELKFQKNSISVTLHVFSVLISLMHPCLMCVCMCVYIYIYIYIK